MEQYLKAELLGNIFPAIAYGIIIVLSGNCFHLLQKKRGIYSNRMRIFLLIYVIIMLLLSTSLLIQSIYDLILDIDKLTEDTRLWPFQLPFIIWGADGFMVSILILRCKQRFAILLQVWRCIVLYLYQDVSKGSRLAIIILLSLLSFASFGRLIFIYSPK